MSARNFTTNGFFYWTDTKDEIIVSSSGYIAEFKMLDIYEYCHAIYFDRNKRLEGIYNALLKLRKALVEGITEDLIESTIHYTPSKGKVEVTISAKGYTSGNFIREYITVNTTNVHEAFVQALSQLEQRWMIKVNKYITSEVMDDLDELITIFEGKVQK